MKVEKRVIGIVGAIGVACQAGTATLIGTDIVTGASDQVKIVALGLSALGIAITAGVQYYKASLSES